jgi:two-component system response regulator YesN
VIELLLVDDETYVTDSLKATIPWEALGISEVYAAASAAEALRLLERRPVDILVTDIRMPEMDGLELIERVSARWPNVRCLLLTGHTDFEYAKRAIRLQAFDYILKPVNDEEFMRSIASAVDSLRDEWAEAERVHRMRYRLKSDRSILSGNLIRDLALGRPWSRRTIEPKLREYEIPLNVGGMALLMLVTLGKPFADYDAQSLSLIEYAVGNIAEEVFAASYRIWHGKAPHDGLLLLAAPRDETAAGAAGLPMRVQLEPVVREFHRQVRHFLKGDIATVVSPWFVFPDELASAYRAALTELFRHGEGRGAQILFQEETPADPSAVKTLESLYRPPTLIQLLESKNWQAAEHKINEVFDSLERMPATREHLYEAFLSIANAYLYLAHKQGVLFHQIDQSGLDPLLDPPLLHAADKVRAWALDTLDSLRRRLAESERDAKSRIVRQVQELVMGETGEITVRAIAERVFLHPVYLSKIFKSETGESLGDYIIRVKMERARYLLQHTNRKIYEITAELGYQNPQYFSKMFKKYYGMTPNEYRER